MQRPVVFVFAVVALCSAAALLFGAEQTSLPAAAPARPAEPRPKVEERRPDPPKAAVKENRPAPRPEPAREKPHEEKKHEDK